MPNHNQTKTLDSIHCNFVQKFRNIFKTGTFMNYSNTLLSFLQIFPQTSSTSGFKPLSVSIARRTISG